MSSHPGARANRRVVCVMVALMGVVFALGGAFFGTWLPQHQADTSGLTAQARGQVSGYETDSSSGTDSYRVLVAFTPAASATAVQLTTPYASAQARENWPTGTAVDVLYDPHAPSHASAPQIDAQETSLLRTFGNIFMVGGSFLAVIGLSILFRT